MEVPGLWLTVGGAAALSFVIYGVHRGSNNQGWIVKMRRCSRLGVAALLAGMASALVGCSSPEPPTRDPDLGPETTVRVFGHPPNWNLDEMVRRSDAIVIGRLTKQLRTEREPGSNNNPPRYYYEFTDFELSVERSLQPAKGFPPG